MIQATSLPFTPGKPATVQTPQSGPAAPRPAAPVETPVAIDPPKGIETAMAAQGRDQRTPGKPDDLPPGPKPTFQETVLQRIQRTALDAQARAQEMGAAQRPTLPDTASEAASAALARAAPPLPEPASDRAKEVRVAREPEGVPSGDAVPPEGQQPTEPTTTDTQAAQPSDASLNRLTAAFEMTRQEPAPSGPLNAAV